MRVRLLISMGGLPIGTEGTITDCYTPPLHRYPVRIQFAAWSAGWLMHLEEVEAIGTTPEDQDQQRREAYAEKYL